MSTGVRAPIAAGSFYPSDPVELAREVDALLDDANGRLQPVERRPWGIVVPHAGYRFSGPVAAGAYAAVRPWKAQMARVLLLGPAHFVPLAGCAVPEARAWATPLGEVDIDEELRSDAIREGCLADDPAHAPEHAIEVQLPFLHRFRPDVRIVPVALGRLSLEECRELGENVADAIAGDAERPLLVASSDMSHYVPDAVARTKDRMAIDRMLALDPEGLYRTVRTERISMCGVLPATVVLFAARRLGATSARLIRYATSGDVSREFDQVVGYAGLAFR